MPSSEIETATVTAILTLQTSHMLKNPSPDSTPEPTAHPGAFGHPDPDDRPTPSQLAASGCPKCLVDEIDERVNTLAQALFDLESGRYVITSPSNAILARSALRVAVAAWAKAVTAVAVRS